MLNLVKAKLIVLKIIKATLAMVGCFCIMGSSIADEFKYSYGFHGKSTLRIRGDSEGGRVFGSNDEHTNLASSYYSYTDEQNNTIYELSKISGEQSLVKYSRVSFGPLSGYLPMETNIYGDVVQERVNFIKYRNIEYFTEMRFFTGLMLQRLNLTLNGAESDNFQGLVFVPVIGFSYNKYLTSKISFFIDLRKSRSVGLKYLNLSGFDDVKGIRLNVNDDIFLSISSRRERNTYAYSRGGNTIDLSINPNSFELSIGYFFK